ncbi:probable cytochrome P450 6a13 [Pieris napi]|uniref:probable cytochrome P450 6a13 n=1 Tax=Pieris napi TaxID=78633 RepID=UPI001FB8E6BB|nr:probable cytochrome P450 6a13 [Pieris napi]
MAVLQLTSSILHEIFLLGFVSLLLVYVWFKYRFTYWARKGVQGPRPEFPFGNVRQVIQRKQQFFQPFCDTYFQFKKLPYVGVYSFHTPVLCINDPDLAKHIIIKDFDHFQSHGIFSSASVGEPLGGHLFNIAGPKWRNIRTKISPAFTPVKLKSFFPLVEKIASQAVEYGDAHYAEGKPVDFSEFYAKYAMEIVGSVGFGVENDGLKKETEFYQRGNEYFVPKSIYWTVIRAISFFAPDIFKKMGVNRTNPAINNFFYGLVKDTVSFREKNNYYRNDFLQTLIELQKSESEKQVGNGSNQFTFTDVAANTMLYMFAGYETSATTGMFAAYEMARNPQVQDKVRQEVQTVLAKYNGQFTYEAQNEMTYMNMVLDETMRKHPPLRALFRRCNKDYKLPDSDLVIENGTLVFVPIQSIQMDPDIFEDPERFDPERFAPEKKAKMHPCIWMPFGEGPRKCLGLRQGYIQSKMALVKLLTKYEFTLHEKTIEPLQIKPTSLACAAEGGVWINLKPLETACK